MNLERRTIHLKGYVPGETQFCTTGEDRRVLTVKPFAQLERNGHPEESFVTIVENKKVVENQEE